jgi:hypothetical protein
VKPASRVAFDRYVRCSVLWLFFTRHLLPLEGLLRDR